MLQVGIVSEIQWCDTRDMTADGHTADSIDRGFLREVMSGHPSFKYDVKRFVPYRGNGEKKPNPETRR